MQINAFKKLLTNYSEQTVWKNDVKGQAICKVLQIDAVLINTGLTPFKYLAQIFLFRLLFGSQ